MRYNDVIEIQVLTDATTFSDEPVTLTEVKSHLNLHFDTSGSYDFNDDDTKLENIIRQSRQLFEQQLWVAMVTKNVRAILRNECGGIELPYGPVVSITSVLDIDGNTLTEGTGYKISGNQFKWIDRPLSCYLDITYQCGYYREGNPAGLRRALLEQIAWNYVNAGDQQQQFANGSIAICESAMAKAAAYSRRAWVS